MEPLLIDKYSNTMKVLSIGKINRSQELEKTFEASDVSSSGERKQS